jgi:hypothetical protein
MVKQHILKTWLEEFKDIKSGRKPFDFRKNDRDFQLGDTVISAEYNQHSKKFTGEKHEARITYLIKGGKFGIPEGYCIMALKEINKKKVLVLVMKVLRLMICGGHQFCGRILLYLRFLILQHWSLWKLILCRMKIIYGKRH